MASLEDRIKEQAHALGFELAGIARATPADSFDRLRGWLEQDYAGTMAYLHRQAEARRHPASILPEVRSVVMLAMNYQPGEQDPLASRRASVLACPESQPGKRGRLPYGGGERGARVGRVARYARGADYHDVLRDRLNRLLVWVQGEVP